MDRRGCDWKALVLIGALLAVALSVAQAQQGQWDALTQLVQNASTQRELKAIGLAGQQLHEMEKRQALRALKAKRAADRMVAQALGTLTPEKRLEVFRSLALTAKARGVNLEEQVRKARGEVKALSAQFGGQILGTVTVSGQPSENSITVVAFDTLGYVADVAQTGYDGSYTLSTGPGKFYVMTVSNGYVDELYNDVPAPFGKKEGWRAATLVEVTASTNAEGIDFDLDDGAVVKGVIRDETGLPLAGEVVTLRLTSATNPTSLLTYEVITDYTNGSYEIHIPAPGTYKLSARTSERGPIWYDGKYEWEQADVVQIASTDDELQNIDFALPLSGAISPVTGGAISGQISGPTFLSTVVVGFAVAFNAADTSVAGIGISLLGSPYVIAGLQPGKYYVWANDILGDVIRGLGLPTASNYLGEFYKDARTPDKATLVEVNDNDTTANINFQLDKGATIQGSVKGPDGQPLDSVLVIAIDAEIASAFEDPFFKDLQIEVSMTDQDGNYMITGLAEGDWVVRTLTILKHMGAVLDEYYDGHHSLWDFALANRISVAEGATVSGIDFTLDAPGYISGTVVDANTGEPIEGAILIPINLNSGLPEAAGGQSDTTGSYMVGPLPTGNYALLCLIDDKTHLSEFYSGAYTWQDVSPVPVTAPNITSGINFVLQIGATIEGFVKFPGGASTGADTLYRFPVVAYEASTGELADYAFVQFPGGYRLSNLLPGQYKVAAIPVLFGYATTYAGGGVTFDDPSSTTIDVAPGAVTSVDISLGTATGSISGAVRDAASGDPLTQTIVAAYDATGHMQGLAAVGMDLSSFSPTPPEDTYRILGLRPGSYYVRTFSITSMIPIGMEFDLSLLPGLGEGGLPDLGGVTGIALPEFGEFHGDQWYDAKPVMPFDLRSMDLYGLGLGLMRHGFAEDYEADVIPVFLPLPFVSGIPEGATAVQVGTGETAGIDFNLYPIGIRELTPVAERASETKLPETFSLRPAYPNPFNPQTRIEWELPKRSPVRVAVYNLLGVQVKELVRATQPAGVHHAVWDGTDSRGLAVPSGVYLIRLEAGAYRATRKVLLMK